MENPIRRRSFVYKHIIDRQQYIDGLQEKKKGKNMLHIKQTDLQKGQICFVLAHRINGRKLAEPKIIECVIVSVGSKFVTLEENQPHGRTYKFTQDHCLDNVTRWLCYDYIYGASFDMEMFLARKDIEEKLEAKKLFNETYNFFNDFAFETRFVSGQISVEQLRLISEILDPETGLKTSVALTEALSTYKKR